MDIAIEITLLQLQDNENIHSFFKRVQDFQTKLSYSREIIDKTRLFKFYLKAIGLSKDHLLLVQGFIPNLNIHICKFGANIAHPIHTCISIYEYLLSIDAPE